MQHRLKSKMVWAALIAQVVSILILLGVIDTGVGEVVNSIALSVCELLVILGVLNNPTDGQAF